MVLAGDELSHSQRGNNNAYCQDNETSWLDWNLGEPQKRFLDFTARIIAMRRRHPVFSRRRFLQRDAVTADGLKEIIWLNPEGHEMSDEKWEEHFARCLGVYLAGAAIERSDRQGRPVKDHNYLLLFNAHHEPIPFKMPDFLSDKSWWTELDTASEHNPFEQRRLAADAHYPLQGRSLVLLRETAYR